MNQAPPGLYPDLVLLYELATILGANRAGEQSTDAFLERLVGGLGLSFAAIWRRALIRGRRTSVTLVNAFPSERAIASAAPSDHPLFSGEPGGGLRCHDEMRRALGGLVRAPERDDEEALAVLAVGSTGWLALVGPSASALTPRRLAMLEPVLAVLGRSLESNRPEVRHLNRIAAPRSTALSAREEDIVALVARGFADVNVAARLGIAESTVGSHLHRIFRKLGVHNRVELAMLFREREVRAESPRKAQG